MQDYIHLPEVHCGKLVELDMGPHSSAMHFSLFERSASPLDWGYLGERVTCMNPYLSANCLNVSSAYCGPVSGITTSGMQWRAKNEFNCSIIDSESVRWSLATVTYCTYLLQL